MKKKIPDGAIAFGILGILFAVLLIFGAIFSIGAGVIIGSVSEMNMDLPAEGAVEVVNFYPSFLSEGLTLYLLIAGAIAMVALLLVQENISEIRVYQVKNTNVQSVYSFESLVNSSEAREPDAIIFSIS